MGAQGADFVEECAVQSAASPRLDILGYFSQPKVAIGDVAPMRTRKNAHPHQIRWLQFHFPPLGVGGKFAPHPSPSAEEQRPSQNILVCVREVGSQHNLFQPLPVTVEFGMIKLVSEKLRNHLIFADPP